MDSIEEDVLYCLWVIYDDLLLFNLRDGNNYLKKRDENKWLHTCVYQFLQYIACYRSCGIKNNLHLTITTKFQPKKKKNCKFLLNKSSNIIVT